MRKSLLNCSCLSIGEEVENVEYDGQTNAEKDSSCCSQCKRNPACEFWTRSAQQNWCSLRKNLVKVYRSAVESKISGMRPECNDVNMERPHGICMSHIQTIQTVLNNTAAGLPSVEANRMRDELSSASLTWASSIVTIQGYLHEDHESYSQYGCPLPCTDPAASAIKDEERRVAGMPDGQEKNSLLKRIDKMIAEKQAEERASLSKQRDDVLSMPAGDNKDDALAALEKREDETASNEENSLLQQKALVDSMPSSTLQEQTAKEAALNALKPSWALDVGPPIITNVMATTVTLRWSMAQGMAVKGYQIQSSSAGVDKWEVRIEDTGSGFVLQASLSDLLPSTEYVFRVLPMNEIGLGTPSQSSDVVQTLPNTETGTDKFSCFEGSGEAHCFTFWKGCTTCGSNPFNTETYSPWRADDAKRFCTSLAINVGKAADEIFENGECQEEKFFCRDGGPSAVCHTFWKGCTTCNQDAFNSEIYSPWGMDDAERYCMSWSTNQGQFANEVSGRGGCKSPSDLSNQDEKNIPETIEATADHDDVSARENVHSTSGDVVPNGELPSTS